MVQTDKLANLNAFKKIEKDILIRLDEIRKRKEEVYPVLVVFPEYTFEDSSKAFAELREIIQHRSKGERIYWGVGVSKRLDSEKGIMNIVEIFQSHSLTKHVKSKLFPIGEREINFYILPNKYFIPAVKVIPGEEELSSFEIGVKGESLQVINAICYESIYLDLLKRALGPKFANRMIVNYSYDGLLKGSSLSYMHDLLTRWNAISLNSHLVRISSREHSAVWDNYGANVISLPLNQDVVKEVDVQFFE